MSKITDILDSEAKLVNLTKDNNNDEYKEYKFLTVTTPDIEKKISQFWKQIELTNLKPVKPKKSRKRSKSVDDESDYGSVCDMIEHPKDTMSWLDTLTMLREKGLEKEARAAKNDLCKICANNDMGKIYADEAYEDRYIKKMTSVESCD